MLFKEKLIPYTWDTSWIDTKLDQMIEVLSAERLPEKNPSCENCAYSTQRSQMEG